VVLYFVGGIHGSGKSTLCGRLAPLIGAEHIKASDLIRERRTAASEAGKAVADVEANQRVLLAALDARKQSSDILLDGHFVLLSTSGAVTEIPLATFRSLDPIAFVLVEIDPAVASDRLATRDQLRYDRHLVAKLHAAEALHASCVARELTRPLLVVTEASTVESIAEFLVDARRFRV
jgi:adenylate kinase